MSDVHSGTAVLDRLVDGQTAVLLLEDDGQVLEEYTVDVETLPADSRHEGAVFEMRVVDDSVDDLTYRPEETTERREAAQERFDRLSERLSDR